MALSDIDDLPFDPNEGDAGHDNYHSLIHRGMKSLKDLTESNDTNTLKTLGNQSAAGTKTFSNSPELPDVQWIPIDNWNMEDPAQSNWALSASVREISTADSHSGTQSLKVTATGGIVDATSSQKIPVLAGELYYGECWVRWENLELTGATTAISMGATITKADESGNSYPSFWNIMSNSIETTRGEWVKISGSFSVSDDGELQIRPSVRGGALSGSVYFDEIRVAKVASVPSNTAPSREHVELWSDNYEDQVIPGEEITLSNQDFELNTGWQTSTGIKEYDSTRSYSGTRSLRIVGLGPGANISEAQTPDHIAVTPGEQYYAECYAWWEDVIHTSGVGISLQCSITNAAGTTQVGIFHFKTVSITEAKKNSTSWVKLAGVVTVPTGGAWLRMRVATREGMTGGTVWFDRVRVRRLTNQNSLYWRGDKTWQTLNKAAAGLGNVANTSDLNKPISSAQQTALNAKQDVVPVNLLNNGSFEKGSLGWTLNMNMSISTDYSRSGTSSLKYTSGTGLGEAWTDPIPVTHGQIVRAECYIYHPAATTGQGLRIQAQRISDDVWVQLSELGDGSTGSWVAQTSNITIDGEVYDHVRIRMGFNNPSDAYVDDVSLIIDGADATNQYLTGEKKFERLDNYAVGLPNVDNTSDINKPISTLQQAALDAKQNALQAGENYQYMRGDMIWANLDSAAVGLGNVNNTSDLSKPISGPTQTALDAKATTSQTLLLTGTQTISGVKTFSSSPKLPGNPSVGMVWHATSTDGTGQWQTLVAPETTVDWDNINNKPATFAPIIGSTPTTAAAGNHTHTKADIGLDQVDNTSDANKPISTLTQAALDTKVATSRSISTSSNLTGGGNLTTNRTIAIATGGVDLTILDTASKRTQIVYVQTFDTRAVGYGQIEDGIKLGAPLTITSVSYRMGTEDASGTTTCELRKNGVTVAGTSAAATTNPSDITGTWTFAKGDVLTVYISAIGATPGKRLTAEMTAILS